LVKADAHDRLALPTSALTLGRAEWVKDPGLELGFNLVWRPPWGVLSVFLAVDTIEVEEDINGGPLGGAVGISGSGYHRS
jgi:hypothetical protein